MWKVGCGITGMAPTFGNVPYKSEHNMKGNFERLLCFVFEVWDSNLSMCQVMWTGAHSNAQGLERSSSTGYIVQVASSSFWKAWARARSLLAFWTSRHHPSLQKPPRLTCNFSPNIALERMKRESRYVSPRYRTRGKRLLVTEERSEREKGGGMTIGHPLMHY